MADNQVYSTATSSGSNYKAPRNGMVHDGEKLYIPIFDVSGDLKIRSSSDGSTWATAHTYTIGGNESILADTGPRIILDHDGYVHVFTPYSDSVLGNRIKHTTNRTGSWVTTDKTSVIGSATHGWHSLKVNFWNDTGTAKAYLTWYDSSTPTIMTALYDLEAGTLDWSEDSLHTDSGGSISSSFAAGINGPSDLGTLIIFYLNGTTSSRAYRTGVATWFKGPIAFVTTRGRTNSPAMFDVLCPDTGSYSYFAMGFNAAGAGTPYVELFTWNTGTQQMTTVGYFQYSSSSEQVPFAVSIMKNQNSDVYVFVAGWKSTGERFVSYASVAGGSPLTVIRGSTSASDPDYIMPMPLVMHPQKNFSQSTTTTNYLFAYYKRTDPSTYEFRIYTPATTVAELLDIDAENRDLEEGMELGDSFVYSHLGPVMGEGAEIGDDIYGVNLNVPMPEGAEIGESISSFKEMPRTISEGADIGDTVEGQKADDTTISEGMTVGDNISAGLFITGAAGDCTYPIYTCESFATFQNEGDTGASNAYTPYTIVAAGKNAYLSTYALTDYPEYTIVATGENQVGGTTHLYDVHYDPYTVVATTAQGWIGTGSMSYPAYDGEGTRFTGGGSGTYDAYTMVSSTPGSATETDFVGSTDTVYRDSLAYRAYTVVATTLSNYHGTGVGAYWTYRCVSTGIHSSEGIAAGTYPEYQLLSTGVNSEIGTAIMEYPSVAHAYGPDDVQFAAYTISATGMVDDITAIATMSYPKMYVHAAGTADHLEVFTGRLVDSEGEAFVDGDGNFIVIQDPTPAEYEVVFAAMNLAKKAVTEYVNFNFNSIGRNGDAIYAANANGIYIVFADNDDDGDNIASNMEKLEIDYDAPERKRATDAYIHLKCDGPYEFTSKANNGNSSQTIADTDTELHTRKIDLAKGLIGRSLGWGLKADGTEIELEEIELIVDIGTRRIRRYVS